MRVTRSTAAKRKRDLLAPLTEYFLDPNGDTESINVVSSTPVDLSTCAHESLRVI
jgi:hypothetical protein